MLRSFRVKLTLLAAGTSAFMILGFGVTVLGFVEHAGQVHLDREIRGAAMNFMEFGPRSLEQGGFYGEQLHGIAFRVRELDTADIYTSPGWPQALGAARLTGLEPPTPPAARCPRSHATWAWAHLNVPHGPHGPHGPHVHPGPPGSGPPESGPPPLPLPPPPHGPHPVAAHLARGNLHCPCAQSRFTTVPAEDGVWRVGAFPDGPLTLFVAVDLSAFHAQAAHVTSLFLLALVPTLLAAAAGGWWLAGRALRPVQALSQAAEEITAARLERRIPEDGDLEFARLSRVFNRMLERLQGSYQQAVRFSADVSHELNTPLTIMQGELETALGRVEEDSPAQLALGSQLEEVQRLKGLVQKLLLLARADAGTLRPQQTPCDLSELVGACCEDFQALAPELRFELELEPGVVVRGDPGLLPLVVSNLLANATRYNRPEGFVRVALTRADGRAALRVTNSGPPIEGETRARLFDRFYRGDPARGREAGAGLGLSLSREFARAQGGELELEAAGEAGNTFLLRLPLAS